MVSDLDDDVINLLQVVQNSKNFEYLLEKIKNTNVEENNKQHLKNLYYHYRDEMWKTTDKIEQAYRFLLLRQLCFSGMTRVSSSGKSNVPFGWYEFFKTRLDENHHLLLQNWKIKKQDFEFSINKSTKNDWIFLDPPYYNRNSAYGVDSSAGFSDELHIRLNKILTKTNTKWLLIHSDCELYRKLYSQFIIKEFSHKYTQNFKGNGIKNSKVTHLYIYNYAGKHENNA